jgi:hypothetical protein
VGDQIKLLLVRVEVIAWRPNHCTALGRIDLWNLLIERVEMNVRNARVEQAVEPFYQPENLELQLIRTHDSSLDRGVHRRCVTACCQDADTFHNWTAKVFTIWSPLARSIYSGELKMICTVAITAYSVAFQGFLNLFHTNANGRIWKCFSFIVLASFRLRAKV